MFLYYVTYLYIYYYDAHSKVLYQIEVFVNECKPCLENKKIPLY